MIDVRHPLAGLATRVPYVEIEAALALAFDMNRVRRIVEDGDPFGPTARLADAEVSSAGRLRLPIQLMGSLSYLKHAFNLRDHGS